MLLYGGYQIVFKDQPPIFNNIYKLNYNVVRDKEIFVHIVFEEFLASEN